MIYKINRNITLKIFGLYFCFLLFPLNVFTQKQNTIDSLLNVLRNTQQDTTKINTLGILSDKFRSSNPEKGINYATHGMNISESINYKKGFIICCNKIGIIHKDQCRYDMAAKFCLTALKTAQEIKDKKLTAIIFNNIGEINRLQGVLEQAISYYLKSLKIREELSDKDGVSECYNNIGNVQMAQGNYTKAIEYFQKSLQICEEIGSTKGIASSYNNIGIVYAQQSELDKAVVYFLKSLKINETSNNKNGIAECCNNLGLINEMKVNYSKAVEYYNKSLKIAEEQGDKNTESRILGNISLQKINLKKYNEAIELSQKSLQIAKEIGSLDNQGNSYSILADANDSLGNSKEAYKYFKLFQTIQDSMFNIAKHKQLSEMESKYQGEKKQKEIELKNTQLEKSKVEIKQQKTQKLALLGGLALMLLLILVGIYSYKKISKQKKVIEEKNIVLHYQKDEIATQRDLVTHQKEHIEEIHSELKDSIHYAERIQNAVLPAEDLTQMFLANYFILFKPRDIVSGDFYWTIIKKNWLLVTVADCTGHGVPGAFMSMLGISFLNEIVARDDVQTAGKVLDELREYVIKSLQQKGVTGEQKDGMDIAFIAIDLETYNMQFAGANNPCWIVKAEPNPSQQGLIELKPSKMPIGIHEAMSPFQNQEFQLQRGDIVYLSSDGYEDQFGGPKGKKFLSKKFKELLLSNSHFDMKMQKKILDKTIEDWKNNNGITYEQTDDITLIGIKI